MEKEETPRANMWRVTGVVFIAALIGMIINLTADKVLDQDTWVRGFPFGGWHDEDYMKLEAVRGAVNLGLEPGATQIIRNHSDDVFAAMAFIQHAYPAVQKRDNSKILTGLRYEYLVVKVLRVILLVVVGLYLVILVRAAWMLVKNPRLASRWVSLTLATLVAIGIFELLMWLWTTQSRRYYKKLVYAYIVLASPDEKSLTTNPLKAGWSSTAWTEVNNLSLHFPLSKAVEHFDTCDGSNGISSGPHHFIAVSDEENIIRLFKTSGGKSKALLDLNQWLNLQEKNGERREADVEGAARIGDVVFWVGSHGRSNSGEEGKERQVFFATSMSGEGETTTLQPLGRPYTNLLTDLLNDPALRDLNLSDAAQRAPKLEGALNIESICAIGQSLYLGFRNPLPDGKALVIELKNPSDVAVKGFPAIFGNRIFLELDGLGVRDMIWWRNAFLVVAGDYRDRFEGGARPPKLFLWRGIGKQPIPAKTELGDLNLEAAVLFQDGDQSDVLLLSDDGNRAVDGKIMRSLAKPQQRFRGVWLREIRYD